MLKCEGCGVSDEGGSLVECGQTLMNSSVAVAVAIVASCEILLMSGSNITTRLIAALPNETALEEEGSVSSSPSTPCAARDSLIWSALSL